MLVDKTRSSVSNKHFRSLLLGVAAISFAVPDLHAATMPENSASAFDDTVVGVIADSTPWVAVAITSGRKLCYAHEYARSDDHYTGPTPRRFHAASISKLLTATLIMQLQQEGKLSIYDPAGKYEPLFASSTIKLVHLLTQTSGLQDQARANGRREPREVEEYFVALAKQQISTPGQQWQYSDAGYNLLGRIVERITHRPFAEVMRERILVPLSMHDSDFDIARIPAAARLVAFDQRGQRGTHPWDLAFSPELGIANRIGGLSYVRARDVDHSYGVEWQQHPPSRSRAARHGATLYIDSLCRNLPGFGMATGE